MGSLFWKARYAPVPRNENSARVSLLKFVHGQEINTFKFPYSGLFFYGNASIIIHGYQVDWPSGLNSTLSPSLPLVSCLNTYRLFKINCLIGIKDGKTYIVGSKNLIFFRRVGSVLSTVSVTLERFFAIVFPLRDVTCIKRWLIPASTTFTIIYNFPKFFEISCLQDETTKEYIMVGSKLRQNQVNLICKQENHWPVL